MEYSLHMEDFNDNQCAEFIFIIHYDVYLAIEIKPHSLYVWIFLQLRTHL